MQLRRAIVSMDRLIVDPGFIKLPFKKMEWSESPL